MRLLYPHISAELPRKSIPRTGVNRSTKRGLGLTSLGPLLEAANGNRSPYGRLPQEGSKLYVRLWVTWTGIPPFWSIL